MMIIIWDLNTNWRRRRSDAPWRGRSRPLPRRPPTPTSRTTAKTRSGVDPEIGNCNGDSRCRRPLKGNWRWNLALLRHTWCASLPSVWPLWFRRGPEKQKRMKKIHFFWLAFNFGIRPSSSLIIIVTKSKSGFENRERERERERERVQIWLRVFVFVCVREKDKKLWWKEKENNILMMAIMMVCVHLKSFYMRACVHVCVCVNSRR